MHFSCCVVGIVVVSLGAGVAVSADRVEDLAPPVGQVHTYNISGGGAGSLALPGSDQSMQLQLNTKLVVQRKVTAVDPNGSVTTDQAIVRNMVTVNGQEVGMGQTPRITITTDRAGKIQKMIVNGREGRAPVGPAVIQSLLAVWQLPNRDYQPGEDWQETIPLPTSGSQEKAPEVRLAQTYLGMKPLNGQSMMAFASHLESPVKMAPRSERVVGGFNVDSVTVSTFNQTSFYDPHSGALVSADTHLAMDLHARVGGGEMAIPMTIRMPVLLKTRLAKSDAASQHSTMQSLPGQVNNSTDLPHESTSETQKLKAPTQGPTSSSARP